MCIALVMPIKYCIQNLISFLLLTSTPNFITPELNCEELHYSVGNNPNEPSVTNVLFEKPGIQNKVYNLFRVIKANIIIIIIILTSFLGRRQNYLIASSHFLQRMTNLGW